MKPEPMKPEAIVKETIEHYWPDPAERRAIDENSKCHYITPDGRMCAIGRCLTKETLAIVKKRKLSCDVEDLVVKMKARSLDDLLKPEYHGHSLGFWAPLQHLHDSHFAWRSEGDLRACLIDRFPSISFGTLNLPPRP